MARAKKTPREKFIEKYGEEEAEELEGRFTFTKGDFETGAPYEMIAQQGTSFLREQMQRALARYAELIGVTGFAKMYNAYLSSLKDFSPQRERVNVTEFTGQEVELDAGSWYADDTGVWRETAVGTVWACLHPIMPVGIIQDMDTGEESVRIAWRHIYRETWDNAIFPAVTLASASGVVQLASKGIQVSGETARALSSWLMEAKSRNVDRLPVTKSISRLGYIYGGGFSPYISGLVYGGDGSFATLFNAVSGKGTLEDWKKTALDCMRRSIYAKIALGASFGSALIHPLGLLPFFCHFWSPTSGNGKTLALMLAASVWGDPSAGALVKNFNGTTVGMERTAGFLHDVPFCIDELQLARDARGRDAFNIYSLAEGSGRLRGRKEGGVDPTTTWSNVIITTGESPLEGSTKGGGAVNRVLNVEIPPGEFIFPDREGKDSDGAAIASSLRSCNGTAGQVFTEFVQQNIEEIRERYDALREIFNGFDTSGKQAMAAAVVTLGQQLMVECLFPEDAGEAMSGQELVDMLASREETDVCAQAYDMMCGWVAQHSSQLPAPDDSTSQTLGVIDGDRAYIIAQVFSDALEQAGYSARAVTSWMAKKGKLVKDSDGKHVTVRHMVGSARVRCYCLVFQEPGPRSGGSGGVPDWAKMP